MNIILRLAKMAICHKWNLILAYMCMLGATTSFLMTPKFIGKAIDKITTSSSDGIPTNIIIEIFHYLIFYTIFFIIFNKPLSDS